MLEKEECCLASADRKILLDFPSLLSTEGWIRQHHVEAVLFLNVGEVLGEAVGVDDVGRLDAMQDHVHDRDDIGERLLFLAVEGARLESAETLGGEAGLGLHEIERLAQEARRADGSIVNALADFGLLHLYHGADE